MIARQALDLCRSKVIIQPLNIHMAISFNEKHELTILEHIEENPDATQASLASQIGVAVGTVNWYLQRMVAKGYIKVRRMERRKLRYIITPEGIALRARLTFDFIQNSFQFYRLVRDRMVMVIQRLKQMGVSTVRLEGNGDVAEICRLTCLEHGITVCDEPQAAGLRIHGLKIFILGVDEVPPVEPGDLR